MNVAVKSCSEEENVESECNCFKLFSKRCRRLNRATSGGCLSAGLCLGICLRDDLLLAGTPQLCTAGHLKFLASASIPLGSEKAAFRTTIFSPSVYESAF